MVMYENFEMRFFFSVPTLVFSIQKKIFDIFFFFAYSDCAYILKPIFFNTYIYVCNEISWFFGEVILLHTKNTN